MELFCTKCRKNKEVKTNVVTFKNGTKHIEGKCFECHTFIKWIPQEIIPHNYKMPFGKYKGKTLGEIKRIDDDYLWYIYDIAKPRLKDLVDKVLGEKVKII